MSDFTLSGVDAGYGQGLVLNGLSLTVASGEVYALLGRNGMGKTTAVRAAFGLLPLQAGHVAMGDHVFPAPRAHAMSRMGLSVVPQGRGIVPGLTVEENLELGASNRRGGPWSLSTIYEMFPILSDRRRLSGTVLSGGEQQMLAIGRALLANPTCLLLDEPTEGLAPLVVQGLASPIRDLASTHGLAVLLIEQNLRFATSVATRYGLLEKGTLVDEGPLGSAAADHSVQNLEKALALGGDRNTDGGAEAEQDPNII